jgi:hypothetical protein
MRHSRLLQPGRHAAALAAAAFVLTGTSMLAASESAATTISQPTPASLSVPGALTGVATISSSNAWAVGATVTAPQSPILAHWNGKNWTTVSSPAVPSHGRLVAVAKFTGGAWAAGGASGRPLILRLTGTTVRRVAAPRVPHGLLIGLTATSARSAWAVGGIGLHQALIMHWNGKTWKRTALGRHPGASFLTGVAATTAANAWAVGSTSRGGPAILHWNGKQWSRAAIPPPAGKPYSLTGIAALSRSDAWAVGFTTDVSRSTTTVTLHWNGNKWIRVKSPNPFPGGEGNGLLGVSTSAAHSVWAVGGSFSGFDGTPMTLHLTGGTWRSVPTPVKTGTLAAVSISRSGRGWAVGESIRTTNSEHTLILHWNGIAWH